MTPPVPSAHLDAARQFVEGEATKGMLRDVLKTTAVGAGLGVGARGLKALVSTLQRGSDIDIEPPANRRKKLLLPLPYAKAAADTITEPSSHPLYFTGMALGGVGGLYGGYRLADKLFDSIRRGRLNAETEKAQREFDEATVGLYGDKRKLKPKPAVEPLPFPKAAAVKESEFRFVSPDTKGKMLGAYLAMTVPLSMLAAHAGYSGARKQTGFSSLEGAAKLRARRLGEISPSPIQAVGVPLDEEEDQPPKVANAVNFQQFMPLMDRRQLSPDEEMEVSQGKSRILPKIFQSYATRIPEMMHSPLAAGAAAGGLGAAGGGALGHMLGHGNGYATAGGAGLGGLLGALYGGLSTKAHNEGLEEMMRRLPAGSTKRDLQADPVYNQESRPMPSATGDRAAAFANLLRSLESARN